MHMGGGGRLRELWQDILAIIAALFSPVWLG